MTSIDILPGVDSYARTGSHHMLGTGLLGPCMGIVVYSSEKNIAYVAHLGTTKESLDTLDSCLAEIKSEFGTLEGLEVYLGGKNFYSAYKNDPEFSESEHQRAYDWHKEAVIQKLKSAGFEEKQIEIHWGDLDHTSMIVYDTGTRRPYSHQIPYKLENLLNIET